MEENTTAIKVIKSFRTHPLCKELIPSGLEYNFLISAIAIYELEIGDLGFDETTNEFSSKLSKTIIYILGMLMYVEYLTRLLDYIQKTNGFSGKELSMIGIPSSKTVTKSNLTEEISRVTIFLNKLKSSAY